MKKYIVVGLVIALVVVASIVGVNIYRRSAATSTIKTSEGELAKITRGSLTIDVKATGRVEPEGRVMLGFKSAGRVAELLVKEGQRVAFNMPLARLEMGNLLQAVRQAESGLKAAQAQLAKAQAGARQEEIASAQAVVDSAEANAKAAEKVAETARGNLASAEAALRIAKATYDKLLAPPTALELQIAEKQVEAAKNNLWGLQGQRDALGGPMGNSAQRASAEGQVAAAQTQVEIAILQLERLKAGAQPEDIAIAKAQVEQAEAGVLVAKGQLAQAEAQVDSAKAQARQAKAQLDLLKAGARSQDIAVLEAQVAQAEATLSQAQLALEDATLLSPIGGLVAEIKMRAYEMASPGQPAIILVDDSAYHVTVDVDEADIGRIVEGQSVQVTLDAYPDVKVEGKVARISPVANAEGGVTSYKLHVDLISSQVPLRQGLTANATITTKRLDNAILVPNEAILVDDASGKKYVAKVVGEETQLVPIEIGYQTTAVSQVLGGLEPGDMVLLRSSSYREQFRNIMSSLGRSTFTEKR